jgi:hypothetical protein
VETHKGHGGLWATSPRTCTSDRCEGWTGVGGRYPESVSVFIFDQHGVQELPAAHTIVRTGPFVSVHLEKREARGDPPVAMVHLADQTMVSLVRPQNELEQAGGLPRNAGRAPGVYVRLDGVTHAFPNARYGGVSFRVVDGRAFIEVFSSDHMFISNFLRDLDAADVPHELVLAVLRFAPGVIVGDGSKGLLRLVNGEA